MTVTYREDTEFGIAEFHVTGHISLADYTEVVEPLQRFIDAQGKVRIIEVVEKFPTFSPSILVPGIQFDLRNLRYITHVAVVSDIGWISPVIKATGAILSTKLRLFQMQDLEEARDWVRTADRADETGPQT